MTTENTTNAMSNNNDPANFIFNQGFEIPNSFEHDWFQMKHVSKIINGTKYNTATAVNLISKLYSPGYNYYHRAVVLYQKPVTGEFFSLVAQVDNSYRQTELTFGPRRFMNVCLHFATSWTIKPLTEKEAKAFAEEYGTGDEYESIFGEVEE